VSHALPVVNFDLRPVPLETTRTLFEEHHGYGSVGGTATYCFGVFEGLRLVAAFTWQPPPFGAAKSVCPEEPQAVLALSRMVAVGRDKRSLNHVSRPLKRQMRHLIDRGRWPVLLTYSDEGQGHTGHVYRCSGFKATTRKSAAVFEDADGRRRSVYRGGRMSREGLTPAGRTWLQRWERWGCPVGSVRDHMAAAGWARVPIPGKFWRSGNQAHRFRCAVTPPEGQVGLFS